MKGFRRVFRRQAQLTPVLLVLVLGGCHSGSPKASATHDRCDTLQFGGTSSPSDLPKSCWSDSSDSLESQDAASNSAAEANDDPALKNIGTLTYKGQGSTVAEDVFIGPATQGPEGAPPSEVLDACGWSSDLARQQVWIHGRVHLQYSGSVATEVQLLADRGIFDISKSLQFGGGQLGGWVFSSPSGSFENCDPSNPNTPSTFTLQPGANVDLEVWGLLNIISNAHPKLTNDDLQGLLWTTVARDVVQPAGGGLTASGPGAVHCETEATNNQDPAAALALYAKPGFTYQAKNIDGEKVDGTCRG